MGKRFYNSFLWIDLRKKKLVFAGFRGNCGILRISHVPRNREIHVPK